ncbi:MAG: glycosyltransferase family 2 protein [Candidatus Sumerlaeaceae bacterium]|nr:glycosyltransferase family 2 protein [Candidatus Sumerlaeaceae bacterium]
MTKPCVSVVIVTYQRRKDLELALESIAKQCGVEVEAVIVDNGSTDGTAEMVRQWRKLPVILHCAGRNLGASVGRNVGIRLARAPYIAFMDSDAVALDDDLLSRLVAALELHPEAAASAPAIYEDAEKQKLWFLAGYPDKGGYHDVERSRREWRAPHYISTCFSVWRREVLEDLGGFDPAYPYIFEDLDLCARARDRGWQFVVLPDAAVQHRLSTQGRVRPADGYEHRFYTERVMNRFYALRLGARGFLKRWRWWLSPEGRECRRIAYIDFPLSAWRRFVLFWWLPAWTLGRYLLWRASRGRISF